MLSKCFDGLSTTTKIRVKIAKYYISGHSIVYFLDALANKVPVFSFSIGRAVE